MKTIFFVLAFSSLSSFANSSRLFPNIGETICYKRIYSKEHLSAHPTQKLDSLYLMIEGKEETSTDEGASTKFQYRKASVAGHSKNEMWGNTAYCDNKGRNHIFCYVECDGGSFHVYKKGSASLFSIAKDYMYPLFRYGASINDDSVSEADTLRLSGSDRENAVYKLAPAPVQECIEATKQIKVPSGC